VKERGDSFWITQKTEFCMYHRNDKILSCWFGALPVSYSTRPDRVLGRQRLSALNATNDNRKSHTHTRARTRSRHCSFNRVEKPGCTTGLTTGCIHDAAGCLTGCQTGLTTALTTGVSCKRGLRGGRRHAIKRAIFDLFRSGNACRR